MRILTAHNFYLQTGGEDAVFFAEANLLEQHGHAPLRFVLHNEQIQHMAYLSIAGKTIWNRQVHHELAELVRLHGIDVVHFHNTFPLISHAAYAAVRREGAAVVQTLHNYRLLCPSATLYRDGHDCEDCLHKKLKLPAIQHRCYRNSYAATSVLTSSLAFHHWRDTFRKEVDRFIAPTESVRCKFVEAGFSAEQIVVKPHFVDHDPGVGSGGDVAVFVGRLSHDKGVETLLAAWKQLNGQVPLKIVGDGPLRDAVIAAMRTDHSIEWLGRRPLPEVYTLLGKAACVVIPSQVRETFGRVAIESFATGTPVIAANHGALSDVLTEQTGLSFIPGDAADLASAVKRLLASPARSAAMRHACRQEYLAHYTAEQNYPQLLDIYHEAILHAQQNPATLSRTEIEEDELSLPDNQLG